MKTMQKDLLKVNIYDTRDEMGKSAAADIKACILSLLETKETINMIFAAAPSQNEVLYALATDKEIPWNRVNAFHMDEYIGLSKDAPQGFGNFLKAHIFGLADFKSVNYIDISAPDADAECDCDECEHDAETCEDEDCDCCEDQEVYIMKIVQMDDDMEEFLPVEDEALMEKLIAIVQRRFDGEEIGDDPDEEI